MRKHICHLLLVPMIFLTVSCAGNEKSAESSSNSSTIASSSSVVTPKGPVDVVIISGQSNAVGCTHSYYIPDMIPSPSVSVDYLMYSSQPLL